MTAEAWAATGVDLAGLLKSSMDFSSRPSRSL